MRKILILIFLVFIIAILNFFVNYYLKNNSNLEIYTFKTNSPKIPQNEEKSTYENFKSSDETQNKEIKENIQILEIKNIPTKKEDLLNKTKQEENINTSTDNEEILEIEVTVSEFKFEPNVIEAKEGQNVRIKIKNQGTIPHNFKIEKENSFVAQSSLIAPGETGTLEFKAPPKGEYDFYCSVGNHKLKGMFGKFIVK